MLGRVNGVISPIEIALFGSSDEGGEVAARFERLEAALCGAEPRMYYLPDRLALIEMSFRSLARPATRATSPKGERPSSAHHRRSPTRDSQRHHAGRAY